MFLNIDLLVHFVPFWHFGYFGPHTGGISPFMIFFGAMILFLILRRSGGYNRRRGGGCYRPGPQYPPNYRTGPPYQGQGPMNSDATRPEQGQHGPGGSNPYNPYAGQYSGPYGTPYGNQYGGYGAPVPPTGPGQDTIRVDAQGNGQSQPTTRVDLPATTVRMGPPQPTEAGSHQTTPLGSAPQLPPEKARIELGDVDQAEGKRDQI